MPYKLIENLGHTTAYGFKWYVRTYKSWLDLQTIFSIIPADEYDLAILSQLIEPKTIIDCGGHLGSFGVFAKSLWPKAKLIAIEPDRELAELYHRNLEVNGFDGIVINKAAGYNPEKTHLVSCDRVSGGSVLVTKKAAETFVNQLYRYYTSEVEVELITLEEIIDKYNLDIIDLVKWDCEGSEVDIFDKISDEAASKFRFMVGEAHLSGRKYGTRDMSATAKFWRNARRKFPHLNISSDSGGQFTFFQAWPKETKT